MYAAAELRRPVSQYTTYGHVAIERRQLQPDEVQRDVERALDRQVLVLARQAHIEPAAALRDDLARLVVAHPLQQRLVHELAEILLVEAHQHAVGRAS